MSIKIVQTITNKIISDEGEVLLKYPDETLLNKINSDLWNVIMKVYWDSFPIAIGWAKKKYDRFRQVTSHDYCTKNFFKAFVKYYYATKKFHNLDKLIKNGVRIYISIGEENRAREANINNESYFVGCYNDEYIVLTYNFIGARPTPINIIKNMNLGNTYTIMSEYATLFIPNDISFIK